MRMIFVSLLLLILMSSSVTITDVSASKASEKGERITEKTENKVEDIGDKLRALAGSNNNHNDNYKEDIETEFDDSESKGNDLSDNNDKDKVTIADELRELAKLKDEGVITEEEFTEMKEDLIK